MAVWTAKDDERLCKLVARHTPLDAIAARFPERTRRAVAARIAHVEARVRETGGSKRRWSPRETALLMRLRREKLPFGQIARRFPDRSPYAVSNRIKALMDAGKIKKRVTAPRRPWTAADDARLKALYRRGTKFARIGQVLRRTVPAVTIRVSRLLRLGELSRSHDVRPWGPRDERRLAQLRAQELTAAEIAKVLRRTQAAVKRRAGVLVRKGRLKPLR